MSEQRPIPKDPAIEKPSAPRSLGGSGETVSLALVLSGTGALVTDGGTLPVSSGALCLWRTALAPTREGTWQAAELRFGAGLLSDESASALSEAPPIAVYAPEPWALDLAHALFRAASAADGATLLPSRLAETLVSLALESARAPLAPVGTDLRIRRVCAYVRAHYQKKLSVALIANAFAISPNYLGKCFREEMHLSLPEYIKRIRLQEAMRLITETNDTLEQIAYETGFRAYACFFREFKKHFGQTPLGFRRQKA